MKTVIRAIRLITAALLTFVLGAIMLVMFIIVLGCVFIVSLPKRAFKRESYEGVVEFYLKIMTIFATCINFISPIQICRE